MTTEYKLNQRIRWTAEDRAKGECPVPAGSDVTVWCVGGLVSRGDRPQDWDWGVDFLTAYLVHSVPREPIVRWMIVGGGLNGCWYDTKEDAERLAAQYGGRVVKLVEVME